MDITLSIDLQRMIEVGARRLIIDMPIVRTILFTKPILWGGTAPTIRQGSMLEVRVDGTGFVVHTKVQSTGNFIVDSSKLHRLD